MSRRLTKNDKARLLEHTNSSSELEKLAHFIDPNDSSEFHEGMAAGLLLALEIVSKNGGLNAVSAQTIHSVVCRCIQESESK